MSDLRTQIQLIIAAAGGYEAHEAADAVMALLPDSDRLLVERDALKSECIRMMDEIATLKRQAEDVQRCREALARAHEELAALRLEGMCNTTLDCGGTCYLHKGHESPCLCTGDKDGPGSCPA